MVLAGKKVGVLIGSDFYEKEIFYHEPRFPEEGIELHCPTRLWGRPALSFRGHAQDYPFECDETFEGMSNEGLRSYAAIIVPPGIVSDRFRHTEDVADLAPATEFGKRAFAEPTIVKGVICHGLWVLATAPELVRGRRLVCHDNLVGDARNMGAICTDADVVVDGDLVTARTGGHCHLFARGIIEVLEERAIAAPKVSSLVPGPRP